ncbi:TPA: O53 family O-antigen polymerase [Escherichia coli]|uniref:O53 family O-antigen polymerase n=1 Tax=Escherichia coli TaxID=562 RepID=UPI001A02DB46|nr:O53 family O-antigen polymerase [Escherichia coli]EGO6620638.1 O53 family O-antigen polymerase [Escherichia coli]MDZ3866399.1 O53 family O-antigen polymerase [Escherichia coli]HBK2951272.1 O53 family O-antigen polymerase [Escherichia coli]HEC3578408.1 O53 family O-antigen polymerase [Escherichia coli]
MLAWAPKLLLLFFLLSGLIKAISLYININLNYVFIPLLILASLFYMLINRTIEMKAQGACFIFFFSISAILFLVNNIVVNNVYTQLQLMLAVTIQYIFPIIIICLAGSGKLKLDIFDSLINIITKLTFLSLLIFGLCVMYDSKMVEEFYSQLYNHGLIINPFQTSEEGITLRFSGIFSSGFILASYCCFAIIYYYFNKSVNRIKFAFLFVGFVIMVVLTYNRNGMLAFAVTSLFIMIHTYLRRYYLTLANLYYVFLIGILFIAPSFILYFGGGIQNSYSSIDYSAFTKLSTLFSRIDAWLQVLNINDVSRLLFGSGLVQGLGEDDMNFYVDNGYLYLLHQSGLIALVLYIATWSYMFISLSKNLKKRRNHNFVSVDEINMCLLLILVSFTLALLNNLFFEPVFLILVLMKCVTVNNKSSSIYEKNEQTYE